MWYYKNMSDNKYILTTIYRLDINPNRKRMLLLKILI